MAHNKLKHPTARGPKAAHFWSVIILPFIPIYVYVFCLYFRIQFRKGTQVAIERPPPPSPTPHDCAAKNNFFIFRMRCRRRSQLAHPNGFDACGNGMMGCLYSIRSYYVAYVCVVCVHMYYMAPVTRKHAARSTSPPSPPPNRPPNPTAVAHSQSPVKSTHIHNAFVYIYM